MTDTIGTTKLSTNKPFSPEKYQKAIEKLFLIVDKEANTIPFKLNEPQKKILYGLKRRNIILKARQEGISSLILALFAVDFITRPNVRCVVVSHEASATKKLLDKVKFFLDSVKYTFPGELPYKLKFNSREELFNEEMNSLFYIGTAGSKTFGHGDTIHNLHLSELSRYPRQEELVSGILQAVPKNGRVIIESTANGVGDHYNNMWNKAQNRTSTFKPHFLAWFDLPEYKLKVKDGFNPTEEENEFSHQFNIDNEQLAWRRWKLKELGGDVDRFNEQFPSTPEEAFIVSGNTIWPPSLLKWYRSKCKDPLKTGNLIGAYEVYFEPDDKGYVKVWKEPVYGHSYVIGADVSEGIEVNPGESERKNRTDYSCAVVMDRMTAEIVAVWHGRISGDLFGRELEKLGRYYHTALIGVERNFQGLAPLMVLRDLNYPKIYYRERVGLTSDKTTSEMGWRTDRFTRPMMIEEAGKWLRERRISIYDQLMIGEMFSFVRYPDGQGRATTGAWDDRVMALMITIQMYIRNPESFSGNDIEQGGGESLTGGEELMMGEFTDF